MTIRGGPKIAQLLSIGVLARCYPRERVREILARFNANSQRVRDLPSDALVYSVIALGLLMAVSTGEVLRCLLEAFLGWGASAANRASRVNLPSRRHAPAWAP
ncbi:MAG: Insertion element 4 transposase N-terminal, partial [Verrucomicrobiota bacterium]